MWQTVCWGHGQRCVFTQTDEVLRQSSVYLIFVLIQKLFSWQSKDDVEHKPFCIIADMFKGNILVRSIKVQTVLNIKLRLSEILFQLHFFYFYFFSLIVKFT